MLTKIKVHSSYAKKVGYIICEKDPLGLLTTNLKNLYRAEKELCLTPYDYLKISKSKRHLKDTGTIAILNNDKYIGTII